LWTKHTVLRTAAYELLLSAPPLKKELGLEEKSLWARREASMAAPREEIGNSGTDPYLLDPAMLPMKGTNAPLKKGADRLSEAIRHWQAAKASYPFFKGLR
jgi:hypothetical protein